MFVYVCMHVFIYGIQEVFSAHQGSIYLSKKNFIIYIYMVLYYLYTLNIHVIPVMQS